MTRWKERKLGDDVVAAERIMLRSLKEVDAAALYAAVDESLSELGEWLDWCRNGYKRSDALRWIQRMQKPGVQHGRLDLGVFLREDASALVGCVGLSGIDVVSSSANLGYWIRTANHGQGFAREAARTMATHAHTALGLRRLEIAVHPLNLASARVARAIGAKDEGLRRSRIMFRGNCIDAHVYSLVCGFGTHS